MGERDKIYSRGILERLNCPTETAQQVVTGYVRVEIRHVRYRPDLIDSISARHCFSNLSSDMPTSFSKRGIAANLASAR